jgi:hypothetical protein
MLDSTWNVFKQPASIISGFCMLAGLFTLSSCKTNPGYDPAPRMGAEYRFEEGLRKERRPQYLFDKNTRKEMAKMGYPTGQPNSVAPTKAKDNKESVASPHTGAKKAVPSDSLRMDSVYKVRPQ